MWSTMGIISEGLDMLGDEIDRRHDSRIDRLQRQEHARDRQQAQSFFDENMDNSVSRRVADARRAGISPLAALGNPGSAIPSLSRAPARKAPGRGGRAHRLANMVGKIEASTARAQQDKIRAETDNIRLQGEMARLELAKRKLKLLGPTAEAQAQAKLVPRYVRAYDNRGNVVLKDGEMWVTNPEISEGMEGAGGLGHTWIGNMEGMRDDLRRDVGTIYDRGEKAVQHIIRAIKAIPIPQDVWGDNPIGQEIFPPGGGS